MTTTLSHSPSPRLLPASLCEPIAAANQQPPGVRLTAAFISESKQLGSRVARLAMLDAYEHTHGDEWCLRVTVVDSSDVVLHPTRVTRGLLELVHAVSQSVQTLPDGSTATIEIRPEPTAARRSPARSPRTRNSGSSH